MNQRFSCDFALTKKLYYEYSAGMDRAYRKVQHFYTIFFCIFFFVLMISYVKTSIVAAIVTGVIAVLCILSMLYGYRFNAWQRYDRLELIHGGTPLMHVEFNEKSIVNNTQTTQGTISYDMVNRICETKHLMVLVIENFSKGHQGVIVSKADLCGGTVDEFARVIATKCKNIHVTRFWDFLKMPK